MATRLASAAAYRKVLSGAALTPGLGAARGFASSAGLGKERLVILGSGWGGYNIARKVDTSLYDVTVVSPNSYFSFTPFLASTTVGTLEFRCATEPVRAIKGIDYAQARAEGIDFKNKTVTLRPAAVDDFVPVRRDRYASEMIEESAKKILGKPYDQPYDKLVIATGCGNASFNIPGVAENVNFLKDVRDAVAIRNRILTCLELASRPNISEQFQREILSFRVVGGGPTGVEFAAELHDFVEQDVYRLYPHLKGLVSITLYDVAPGILQSFDASLRQYAEKKFSRDGVVVKGNTHITSVGKDWIELEGKEKVPYGLLVWSTGLAVNPFIEKLGNVSREERGQKPLNVDPHLRVLDPAGKPHDGVWAIGDNCMPSSGKLPATAQVASQMSTYLGKTLNRLGRAHTADPATEAHAFEQVKPFKWENNGSMVFIGHEEALVDRTNNTIKTGRGGLSGFAAWFIWRSYYMTLAMSWRNKVLVPIYWSLAFFFGRDVTRF